MSVETVTNKTTPGTPTCSSQLSNADNISPCSKQEQQNQLFEETFHWILDDISTFNGDTNDEFSKQFDKSNDYIRKCMLYNVPHGKKLRGKMVVMVYQALVPNATEEQTKLARVLGWCAEALQAAYLVADDIMDNGETRRGQPCWYRVQDNGMNALNDSFLLEHLAYQILTKHLGHLDCYSELLNLLLSVTYKTIVGQGMDIRESKARDLDAYNDQLYRAIVTYKTGFYTVYLPVALAMVYAGIKMKNSTENELQLWKNVEQVTLDLGRLFQIQDDYIDCFGDKDAIGKRMSADIELAKCTWLVVKAKEVCTEDQMKILKANYGKSEKAHVDVVKALYETLALPSLFAEYQESVYKAILKGIEDLKHGQLEMVLTIFLKMLYKRLY